MVRPSHATGDGQLPSHGGDDGGVVPRDQGGPGGTRDVLQPPEAVQRSSERSITAALLPHFLQYNLLPGLCKPDLLCCYKEDGLFHVGCPCSGRSLPTPVHTGSLHVPSLHAEETQVHRVQESRKEMVEGDNVCTHPFRGVQERFLPE